MQLWQLLVDIGILIGAAIFMGTLCIRLRLSPLVGYLIGGMLVGGPGSLHLVGSPHDIDVIAELGVSLLLFSLGLEFSFRRIRAFPRSSLTAALLQVVVTPLVALPLVLLLGLDLRAALVVGLMVTLSSTASVLRVLADKMETDSYHGRNCVAVLLGQDLAVIPFVILVSLLGDAGGNPLLQLGRTLGGFAAMAAGLYVVINLVASRVLGTFSLEQNREMSVLFAVGTGIGAAVLAHGLGISPAMGAFIAGMMLGASPFATQIRSDVSAFRIVLLTLFFGAAGMVADPLWIGRHLGLVLGVTAGLVVLKTLLITLIFRVVGQTPRLSLTTAICLAQVGEFSFVLGAEAVGLRILSPAVHQLLVSATIVSLIIAPLLIGRATRLSRLLPQRNRGADTADEPAGTHRDNAVFVFGFGPAGRLVTSRILAAGHPDVTVIDLNAQSVTEARSGGAHAEIGDIQQLEVLEHHGLRHASLVIISTPGTESTAQAIRNVRLLSPGARIIARAHYQAARTDLLEFGAHVVAVDEVTVGEALTAEAVGFLERLPGGVPQSPEA